ncbi:energy-coupling factor transporter ATP-binding protein EcfA2 [Bradyrhizobium sp. USDA 3397]
MQERTNSVSERMAALEREIFRLEAARNKPHVTTSGSKGDFNGLESLSSQDAPWDKTQLQLELEEELANLRRGEGRHAAPNDRQPAAEEPDTNAIRAADEGPAAPKVTGSEPVDDPLEAARGRGVLLRDILGFMWPESSTHGSAPYVSVNLDRVLRVAATRLGNEKILRPHQVLDTLLHPRIGYGMGERPRIFLPQIAENYGDRPAKLGEFAYPDEPAIESDNGIIVGPELVAILLAMSSLRKRTNNRFAEGGVRHFLAALILEEIGRVACTSAGLDFARWRDILSNIVAEEIRHYVDLGDSLEAWAPIIDEMRRASAPAQAVGETHAFANDRTEADLLNTGSDAAAIADLLMLRDLKPPVAVGVFGPWGSGKSTLLRMLKDRISDQTPPKNTAPTAQKIVQINFDAWSHADAENLWASLTAELFEQIADTIDGREKADGKLRKGLITEIAKRLRKDTEAGSQVAANVDLQRATLHAAETTLAKLENEPVTATVASEMVGELLAKAKPKQLSKTEMADPSKVKENYEAEQNKKQLEGILEAAGVPASERDPKKLSALLSGLFELPGRTALLFIVLRRSLGRGALFGIPVALVLLLMVAGFAVWLLGPGSFRDVWTQTVSAAPFLTALGALVGTAGVGIRRATPILALAAEFLARKENQEAELNKKRREAADTVRQEREKLESMLAEQKRAAEFATTYSVAAEGRSREGLLRYFINYSPELAEIRKKLGLLASVRRCFQTLEQIMRDKRDVIEGKEVSDPTTGKAVDLKHIPDIERIVVYIDDLDRCSEQHVVQVLQAIHLLLAFDLFVVVVAVDARWLHRAVGKVYSGQLAAPWGSDQAPQATGATVADYLEKIFQLPIWMRPIGSSATVETFVNGIDASVVKGEEPGTDESRHSTQSTASRAMKAVDATPDPTLRQRQTQRQATMSPSERRALAAMAPLAGKSPRGLKRLVNTYRLIRVMRGSTGIPDLEHGRSGARPLYPYLLFALACEVGLTTETAALLIDVANRQVPLTGRHPLVNCVLADSDAVGQLDEEQTALRDRLDQEGMRSAVLTAVRAVYIAASNGNPAETRVSGTGLSSSENVVRHDAIFENRMGGSERFTEAFSEAARFTFRPRNR